MNEDIYPVRVSMTLNVVAGSVDDAPRFIATEFANNTPHDLSSRIFNIHAVDIALLPTELFIVVGEGGYDAASYVAKRTLREAAAQAREWWADSSGETDTVDVLRLDLMTLELERIDADQLP